ncbi:hypothetical protein ACWNS2_13710 [Planococcus plakortidis]
MTYKHHTRLELVEGGNIFKQGDHPTLKFIAYDSLGNEVDLTGKEIEGALYSRNKGIMYEAPASFTDDRIVFTINELIDNGDFQLEFTVTDSADPDYRAKFPSDEYAAKLTIKPSKDNMDFVGVSMTTVAQLKNELQGLQTEFAGQVLPRVDIVEDKQTQLEADYQAAAGALTEDSEVILARKGEPTLRAFNDKVVAQLAETDTKIDENIVQVQEQYRKTAQLAKLKGYKQKLPFPIGFSWTDAPINIYIGVNGEVTTDFDAYDHRYKGVGQTYYVNFETGHNSNNDGLSEGSPLRAIYAALQKSDVATIILADGHYPRLHGLAGFPINKPVNIIAKNRGKVTVSNSEDLTWTKTAGQTNVYQATRSSAGTVHDRAQVDENGDILSLTAVGSIGAVDSTPNSYFISGSTVYVHTFNSRPADISIRVMLTTPCMLINGEAGTVYTEGINFEGGGEVMRSENLTNPQAAGYYAKHCTYKFSSQTNAIRAWGMGRVFFQYCEGARGWLDGFNYHVQNGVVPDVIEVECEGRHNGLLDSGESHNGSTMHDGGRIIRVNGRYHHNKGPNVIDVNEGGESWCVGTTAHESQATPGTVSNVDFKNGNIGASKMWLDNCVSYGSSYSIVTAGAGAEAKTYVRENLMLSSIQTDAGTTLEEYAI